MADIVSEIQKAFIDGKLTVGADTVMKALKNGTVKKVYLTSNFPEVMKNDILHYAKLSKIEVISLDKTNEELRDICKARYNISIVAQ